MPYFRKLFFKKVTGIRDDYILQEGDVALDESDFKLYRGDGVTPGGISIAGAGGGGGGISLSDISVTQAGSSGAGALAYNNSTGVFTYTPPTAAGLGAKTSVSQADVTQHQAALSITESQISDLGSYLTAETNDLSSAVTWVNVPDANITQSSVTQHQAALSITESQISDLTHYTNSDVDSHLNQSNPTDGYVLSWTSGDYAWVAQSGGGGGLSNVVEDTTPQLGGDLDLNSNDITGTGNISITGNITSTSTVDADIVTTDGISITDNNITTTRSNDDLILSTSGTGSIILNADVSFNSSVTGVLTDVVSDTTPQLGGDLDLNSNQITAGDGDLTSNNISLGADTDFQMFHTGSNMEFRNKTGNWFFRNQSDGVDDGADIYFMVRNETMMTLNDDAGVSLYYDNAVHFMTTSLGANVTNGSLTVDTDVTIGGDFILNSTDGNIVFEGTANGSETFLAFTDPTTDQTITFPDATGTVALTSDITFTPSSTDTLTNKSGNISQWTNDSGYLTSGSALVGSGLEPTGETADATDGTDLTLTGGDASGLNAVGGDAIVTGGDGALTDGNVNIGTTQTNAITIGGSAGTTIGGTLAVSGEATFSGDARFNTGVEEAFDTLTNSTGTVTHDCNNGHIFYHTTPSADFTANFTNLGLTAEYATNLMCIINQGATARIVSAVQIGGVGQTINWQGGTTPTGTNNGIDAFSFTILRDGASYVVLGQMVDFT